MIRYSGCSGPTGSARYILSTIRSENQYEPKFIATAMTKANIKPLEPPNHSPSASSRPLSRPSSRTVLTVFPIRSS